MRRLARDNGLGIVVTTPFALVMVALAIVGLEGMTIRRPLLASERAPAGGMGFDPKCWRVTRGQSAQALAGATFPSDSSKVPPRRNRPMAPTQLSLARPGQRCRP